MFSQDITIQILHISVLHISKELMKWCPCLIMNDRPWIISIIPPSWYVPEGVKPSSLLSLSNPRFVCHLLYYLDEASLGSSFSSPWLQFEECSALVCIQKAKQNPKSFHKIPAVEPRSGCLVRELVLHSSVIMAVSSLLQWEKFPVCVRSIPSAENDQQCCLRN